MEATFKEFAKAHVKSDREYDMVVTKKGEAYYIKGGTASVDITLVKDLKGAKVIHNHPDEYGLFGDSFSVEDFKSNFEYKLDELEVISNLGRVSLKSNKSISSLQAALIYKKAQRDVAIDALKKKKIIEYEQLEIMKNISNKYPQFVFKKKG
ncbi:MAG: hypothetical protein ACRDA4_10100 [Filifactoraceae bacterium]